MLGGLWAFYRFGGKSSLTPATAPTAATATPTPNISPEPNLAVTRLLLLKPVEVRPLLPLDEYLAQVKASRSLLGCAKSAISCKCWDSSGEPLLISHQICAALIDLPLPVHLRSRSGEKGGA